MTSKKVNRTVLALLIIHIFLVVYSAWIHSPNPDEVAHLPCGMAIWRNGQFDLYAVNPPLVRLIAALPVLFTDAKLPHATAALPRPEFEFGNRFLELNKNDFRRYFFYARLACIPFTVLGGLLCFLWARELYGEVSGIAALTLWCFSPNIISWGSTICPDLAATSLGLLACYLFWKWLKYPTFSNMIYCGLALGACELSKMTWIILYALWPAVWLIWMVCSGNSLKQYKETGKSLLVILFLSLYILNTLYLYEGTFSTLGSYHFQSDFFARVQEKNVFGLNLRHLPLPVPASYVVGMDIQKFDFESGKMDSYLLGKWSKQQGWWYYYFVGMFVKVPTGTLLLLLLSFFFFFSRVRNKGFCLDSAVLLLPALALFVFVSSQYGFSRHFRYVLPVLPFLFISAGVVFIPANCKKWLYCPCFLLIWTAVSSITVFPHSFSYFNELTGGPKHGHQFLLDSSIDWQQDLYLLRAWQDENSRKGPLFVDYYGDNSPALFGIKSAGKPSGYYISRNKTTPIVPGWYAVSIHELLHYTNNYSYLLDIEPVDRIGYSIYIFHIEPEKKSK
ncbi:MAG: glycosyltransferase family 39 protein [Planctomycetia bacterium]|nr:glycosyltransferase family 39 protein [Planctomycetia bacterium]